MFPLFKCCPPRCPVCPLGPFASSRTRAQWGLALPRVRRAFGSDWTWRDPGDFSSIWTSGELREAQWCSASVAAEAEHPPLSDVSLRYLQNLPLPGKIALDSAVGNKRPGYIPVYPCCARAYARAFPAAYPGKQEQTNRVRGWNAHWRALHGKRSGKFSRSDQSRQIPRTR